MSGDDKKYRYRGVVDSPKEGETLHLEEFFNPYNLDHMRAFKTLLANGGWPKGFIPENVVVNEDSEHLVTIKVADTWTDFICQKLGCE